MNADDIIAKINAQAARLNDAAAGVPALRGGRQVERGDAADRRNRGGAAQTDAQGARIRRGMGKKCS